MKPALAMVGLLCAIARPAIAGRCEPMTPALAARIARAEAAADRAFARAVAARHLQPVELTTRDLELAVAPDHPLVVGEALELSDDAGTTLQGIYAGVIAEFDPVAPPFGLDRHGAVHMLERRERTIERHLICGCAPRAAHPGRPRESSYDIRDGHTAGDPIVIRYPARRIELSWDNLDHGRACRATDDDDNDSDRDSDSDRDTDTDSNRDSDAP